LRNRGAVEGKRFPEPLIEEALETAVNCGHVNTVGQCSLWLFERALGTGELDRAEYLAHQALSSFRACGSSQEQGISHHHLGWLHIYRREYSQAHEHLQIALELVQTDEWALAQVLAALALASALSGRIADAERFAKDGVGTARRLPTCQSLVMALTRAAQASVLSGHAETARSALPELLQALHDLGFQRWVADAVEMTAVVLVSNRPAHTAVLLGASRSLRQALNETTPAFISEDIERCRHQAAQALGTQQCADQEQQGGKMTSRKALAFALHALEGQYDGTGCIV
jgi:tetratricopeptide (TPR) repeat protein